MSEDTTQVAVSIDDELDFEEDGFQPVRADFQITDVEFTEAKSGNGTQLVVTFENEEAVAFPIADRFWFFYNNPENEDEKNLRVQNMGRGQIKRLYKAALGVTKASPSDLVGAAVSAEAWEDDAGFLRIGRYRAAEGSDDDDLDVEL